MQYIQIDNEVLKAELQSRLKLVIPAFHAYGHRVECQVGSDENIVNFK